MMSKDEHGKDDWAVLRGCILFDGDHPVFSSPQTEKPFPLPIDALERIKTPSDDIRDIVLGCEFFLPLTVGPLPQGDESQQLIKTGLTWPKQNK
jgi:hypothetical protein